MTGKTERVVLVKGGGDKWYEQAIFIVNSNAPTNSMPVDFVAEAEKIIDEYNLKQKSKKAVPGNMPIVPIPSKVQPFEKDMKKPHFVLGALMLVACIIIALVLTLGLMS